jgi:hypothetical protein
MAEGVDFVDGVGLYAKTRENTLAGVSGGGGAGPKDLDSPVEDFISGGLGKTQPTGDKPNGSGDIIDSPCEY